MEALAWVGILLLVLGSLGMLFASFSTSLLWGIGCLLLWPVSLLFLVLHWDQAKNPFFLQLAGLGLIFLGGGFR